jgi:hypothetical protein
MAGHRFNKDGAQGDKAYQPDSGLDAKLDRAVPTGEAEAFLLGVGGAHGGRVYPLIHNTISIGRADEADILVSDPSVSARHARLINGSQGFEIEDLGSTNGTLVEGQRVTRAHLRSGARITLGQVEFKFLVDRRVDATMTIIPAGLPTGAQRGALVRYEPPRPPPQADAPPFVPPAPRGEDEGPSLEEIIGRFAVAYKFVQRNGVLIGALAGAGALLGLLAVLLMPAAREAVCLLKLQPEVKANPVDAQWNRGGHEDQEVRFFADAETAFVQPGLVAATLTKALGRQPADATVAATAERFKLESLPDHVYKASYREKLFGTGPMPPTELLAAQLENYLHGEIARALRVFTAQADFLRGQLNTVEADMKKLADEKMRFSQKNSDRLPDEAGPMLGSRMTLETRRAELIAQVRKMQGELDAQRKALAAEGPLAQGKYRSSQIYRESLASLNRKLTEAYAKGLAEGHPEVRQLQDEKQRIETLIEKEMGSETKPLDRESNAGYQELQNRVALLAAQLSAARSDLADTEGRLGRVQTVVGDLPRVQAGVQQLTHMQDATTQLHGQLFEQLKKAELQLNLERVSAESRYEVLSPPHLVRASRSKSAALGVGLGLFAGLFLALATLAVREGRRIFSRALANLDSGQGRSAR